MAIPHMTLWVRWANNKNNCVCKKTQNTNIWYPTFSLKVNVNFPPPHVIFPFGYKSKGSFISDLCDMTAWYISGERYEKGMPVLCGVSVTCYECWTEWKVTLLTTFNWRVLFLNINIICTYLVGYMYFLNQDKYTIDSIIIQNKVSIF
jgi:hypothetical protein